MQDSSRNSQLESYYSAPDTGLRLQRRKERRRRQAAANRRRMLVLLGLVAVVALAVWFALRSNAAGPASALPFTRRADLPSNAAVIRPTPEPVSPTPIFASYKRLKLRLPVVLKELSEVGFHQASYSYAVAMKTPLPDASLKKAKKQKGTGRDLDKQKSGPNAVLTGRVLRMWRTRPGKPDTAVDVGATAGSPVIAPVTGTVVLVKKYKLYDRYTDFQIHIIPDEYPQVDCVMIHTDKPLVKAGDRVSAGFTHIASVRRFSDKMNLQLKHYTKKSGDHVHLQLNDVNDPTYEGLKGAIRLTEAP